MRVTWYIKNVRANRLAGIRSLLGMNSYNYDRFLTSTWNRCLQLIPYFEKMNIKCRVDSGNNMNTDIAILMRWQDDSAYDFVLRLKRKKVKIVLDVCVNYFDAAGIFPGGYGASITLAEEIKKITPIADVVICGSEYIRKRAMEFNANSVYLPESIDSQHFVYRKKQEDFDRKVLRAIWSGVAVKAGEVAELYTKLKERGIPLTIISNKKADMPGTYKYIPWSYYTFPTNIVKGEICLSPRRTDNTYDLGHSHFKIGAFMAQGVPALASPLPSYKEVIEKTSGGRICESEIEWDKTLDDILDNRKMLWEWSQTAYEGMRYYATENIAKKYIEVFEKLISGEKVVSI